MTGGNDPATVVSEDGPEHYGGRLVLIRRHHYHNCRRGLSALAIAAMLTTGLVVEASANSFVPRLTTIGFNQPSGLATLNGKIWVTNLGSNTVTELSGSGALLRIISAARDDLRSPQAIVATGGHLFIANKWGSITELNGSNGSLVRVIGGPSFHFSDPVALAVNGLDLWVVNKSGNTLTEILTTTGHLVRVIFNHSRIPAPFSGPNALTVAGGNLWVTNGTGSTVTELRASSGALVQTLVSPTYQFSSPDGVAYDGTNIWVTNSATNAVSELAATTGALVQVITNSSLNGGYGFNLPSVVLSGAGYIYVVSPPGSSPMVTQINRTSGDSIWMMCNTNWNFNFSNPDALAINGANLWVANAGNNTLTEMNAETGLLVKDFGP